MITITLKTKVWARVCHWHERYSLSYVAYHRSQDPAYAPAALGMPAVVKFELPDGKSVSLTEPIQRTWFNEIQRLSKWSMPTSDYMDCWRHLTDGGRAFTNKAGTVQGYADYVLRVNLGSEPMKMTPVIANGATIQLIGKPENRFGTWCYPFVTAGYFAATNSTVEPAPLGRVEPFHMNGGYDTPVPLLSNSGYAWIDADWVEVTCKENNYPYYNSTFGRTE